MEESREAMSNEEITLGQHHAHLEEDGNLTIFDDRHTMRLSPDEAYNLLIWLHAFHQERLHEILHKLAEKRES
jgi:hypothetical protein